MGGIPAPPPPMGAAPIMPPMGVPQPITPPPPVLVKASPREDNLTVDEMDDLLGDLSFYYRTPPEFANITLRFSTLTSPESASTSSGAGRLKSSASRGRAVPGPGILINAWPKVKESSSKLPTAPLCLASNRTLVHFESSIC